MRVVAGMLIITNFAIVELPGGIEVEVLNQRFLDQAADKPGFGVPSC